MRPVGRLSPSPLFSLSLFGVAVVLRAWLLRGEMFFSTTTCLVCLSRCAHAREDTFVSWVTKSLQYARLSSRNVEDTRSVE